MYDEAAAQFLRERDEARDEIRRLRDEVARLRNQPLDDHPLPWRTGGHPADEPGPRQRTIYDATGEMIGAMFTTAAARRAVDAVNGAG